MEHWIDPRGERDPGCRCLGVESGPVIHEVFPKMKVSKLVELFSEGGERKLGSEEEKPLEELFVAGQGDALEPSGGSRPEAAFDLVRRHP